MDTVNHLKLRLERRHAATVVRALLHAIYFHRTLDNIDPETLDVLETHVAVAGNGLGSTGRGAGTSTGGGGGGVGGGGDTRELEREIGAKVDEFQAAFVDSGADSGEVRAPEETKEEVLTLSRSLSCSCSARTVKGGSQ